MKELIPQMLAGVGGLAGLVALLLVRASRRKLVAEGKKNEADAAKVLSETAVSLLAPAKEQIAQLQMELASAKADAKVLAEQLRDAKAGLENAQAEIQGLRNQVSEMSKDLAEQREINDQLRQAR